MAFACTAESLVGQEISGSGQLRPA